MNGGVLNIQVTGRSDGSEGLESKSKITINDGELFVYAYDDAINVEVVTTQSASRLMAVRFSPLQITMTASVLDFGNSKTPSDQRVENFLVACCLSAHQKIVPL